MKTYRRILKDSAMGNGETIIEASMNIDRLKEAYLANMKSVDSLLTIYECEQTNGIMEISYRDEYTQPWNIIDMGTEKNITHVNAMMEE